MSYFLKTQEVYKDAVKQPRGDLMCTKVSKYLKMPDLKPPKAMKNMNYNCGSTVNPRDLKLTKNPRVLYLGVGGGLELLQFAYFRREKGAVVGLDIVQEVLDTCKESLAEAEILNPWFKSEFVELVQGDALSLPMEDESFDVVAQNGLFNIFEDEDMKKAIAEVYRVLKPGGRFVVCDPICSHSIPEHLRSNPCARAECLSGATTMEEYIDAITAAGFGKIQVRAIHPYRILGAKKYGLQQQLQLNSLELCAHKVDAPEEGPLIFSGRTVSFIGEEDSFDDGKGHVFNRNFPTVIDDRTAKDLEALNNEDLYFSTSFAVSTC